jgi:putative copper resistance protein D
MGRDEARLSYGLMPRLALRAAVPALISTLALALPAPVLGHGATPPPPTPWTLLTGWSLEVHVWLPIVLSVVAYHWAVASVARAHPRSPVPRRRVLAWDAGMAVLFVALQSPIATYDTTLFSVHMVQHLLLMMVAAPLLALGAPVTLLLRVVRPEVRRRFVLPILHSRPVRLLSFPVIAWVLFAGVSYVAHFSPLFDAALESEPMHVLEHGLFLGTALLFWWPVIGADPSPWRMPHAARVLYVFLGMPWSSFLALAIFSAPGVLYPHHARLQRDWGPSPLADQQLAGGIMWVGGDGLFLVAVVAMVAAWMRAEEAEGRRVDARLGREGVRKARAAAREAAPDGS